MSWIIEMTLPKGSKAAFTVKDGKFAVTPRNGDRYKGVHCWDTFAEAEEYLNKVFELWPEFANGGAEFAIIQCSVKQ